MTREEAQSKLLYEYGISKDFANGLTTAKLVDKIFDEHEAEIKQLKERVDGLKTALFKSENTLKSMRGNLHNTHKQIQNARIKELESQLNGKVVTDEQEIATFDGNLFDMVLEPTFDIEHESIIRCKTYRILIIEKEEE